jgi:hypothetical protein
MCKVPKLMKPAMIIAETSMSVCEGKETWHSNRFHSLKLLRSEKGCERKLIVLTPITNTSRVLLPRVKHGTDNQESRGDGTFTYSEKKPNNEETGKVLASRMAT